MLKSIVESLREGSAIERFCTSFSLPSDGLKIEIEDFGIIDGSLSDRRILKLIKEARLASFGWRDQTIIDTRVRNVWEIPASKIATPKASFEQLFGPALKRVQNDLGLAEQGYLEAELHNLLIYEPGQFFSMHQDTEKMEGMLATMTILLPQSFEGGTLVVDQQGVRKSFQAPKSGGGDWEVIAFYADCHHEVKPVTAGCRLALTYNLRFIPSGPLKEEKSDSVLSHKIKQYFGVDKPADIDDHPLWLVYLLDHQYTQQNFSWYGLKGQDRVRAAQLRSAAQDLNLTVHLALAELHETWTAEEDYGSSRRSYQYEDNEPSDTGNYELGELMDEEYSLKHWLNASNERLPFDEYCVPKGMFCWTKATSEFKPFDSQYEGYMGNYGDTVERWYHRAALVLWPRQLEYESFFLLDPEGTLRNIAKVLQSDRQAGCRILNNVLPQIHGQISDQSIPMILEIAQLLGDQDFAAKILDDLAINSACTENAGAIASLAMVYGESWVVKRLQTWSKSIRFDIIRPEDFKALAQVWTPSEGLLVWLLEYQKRRLIEADKSNEKHSTDAEIAKLCKVSVAHATQILLLARSCGHLQAAEKFVDHVLSHPRIYSAVALAELAKSLLKEPTLLAAWEKIAPEAARRLGKEVHARKADDLSINCAIPCNCADCQELARFLCNTFERERVWPLAKARRQHIHSIIERMGIGVSHETRRTGSPQKLVLTKMDKHFAAEAVRQKYIIKCLQELQKTLT